MQGWSPGSLIPEPRSQRFQRLQRSRSPATKAVPQGQLRRNDKGREGETQENKEKGRVCGARRDPSSGHPGCVPHPAPSPSWGVAPMMLWGVLGKEGC